MKKEQAIASKSMGESDEIDLFELLRTIWRGKLWVGLAALIALVIGVWYAFIVATPVYTSSAIVALESRQEQVVDLQSVMTGLSGDQPSINTEVEVIRSRGLIGKVVDELDLVNDPEFNSRLQEKSFISLGAILRLLGIGDKTPPSDQTIKDGTIDAVLSSIQVSNVRDSYVFRITAVTESPEKSALLANTLAELYISEQLEVKFEKNEQATEWLTERVTDLQVELENAEAELKEYSSNTDLVSPETLIALNRQLKDLRDRFTEAQNRVAAREERIASMRAAQEAGDLDTMTGLMSDPNLDRLGSSQPAQDVDREALEIAFDRALSQVVQERARAESQADALRESIARIERQIDSQSSELVRLQQLQREAEASRLIYEYFLSRLKETSVQQGIQQADSRILSRAVVPQKPSAPRKSMILALSLVLGTMAGVGIVLGRELTQTTFRTPEELEARTGLAILGQIPSIPARQRSNVLKYLTEKPNSAAAEAIRNLRTSILLSDMDNPPQIIMSTSSIPGEGKTTQSIALSQNLASMGNKVLLIEGDIRRRVFTEYFDIKGKKGLLAVLSGAERLEDVVVHEPTLQADLLIGEKSSVNAADVFSSERFRGFLNELRKQYDYIIIDTPPVLAVPDARVIGQSVDAILYTVKWDSTTHRMVREGLKSFESVNLRPAGLVLGQISGQGMKRYGYGDSYGSYASYYDN
ncbi:capsular exopolysaccharide family [Roseovarius nanhaiticus]|uniref:non-specific protein-tyrosine kinase n=1 Tax=Roseovarius nanhaiticus TaxID=573024 RepID=A0A1N7EP43_9RHOB|nr:polysaccharide biosynthesis tyrosine autokinase [Roseovarius nanhaiticus]SEK70288.1 capsular exopolysaccharide family [Roseovarius nanhaiticus]SIR89812.1 capsular exopolysaccharide family [Roseovarius nanhaiticus]